MRDKTISATNFNGLWWITQPEMLDILLRQGFTVEEEITFHENLIARGLRHQIEDDRQEAEANFL